LTNDNSISTLIIALSLFASSSLAGNISGGCLNPAIGFAHNFVRLLVTGDVTECKYLWIYILGPALGGILGSLLYKNFFRAFFIKKDKQSTQSI
jgi:glycerol uptake facilitator-like aquaporin